MDSQCTPSLASSVTRLSVPNFDISHCLFCQDTKFVYKGGSRGRVITPLQKCSTYTAAKKIKDASLTRSDGTILRRIEGEDLIAMNILYHKSCYAIFTNAHAINNRTILPLSLLKSIYIQELNRNGVTVSNYHTKTDALH